MMELYTLDGKNPIPCSDISQLNNSNKLVDRSEFGEAVVSTVFLGMDHSYNGGTPVLFETMIFGGEHDLYQERYCTWGEAEEGHRLACELVNKKGIDRENKLNDLGI